MEKLTKVPFKDLKEAIKILDELKMTWVYDPKTKGLKVKNKNYKEQEQSKSRSSTFFVKEEWREPAEATFYTRYTKKFNC